MPKIAFEEQQAVLDFNIDNLVFEDEQTLREVRYCNMCRDNFMFYFALD